MAERVHVGVITLSDGKIETPQEGTLVRTYTRATPKQQPAPVLRVTKNETAPPTPPNQKSPVIVLTPPRATSWWSRFTCF